MIDQLPQRDAVGVAGLEFGDRLRHLIPGSRHIASRVGHAIGPKAEHTLEVVRIGHRRVVAGLAAADQAATFGDIAQQLHFRLLALGPGHRMFGVIALAPRTGGGGVEEPAAIGMGGQFRGDARFGIGHRLAVAEGAAGEPLAVLGFHLPPAHPLAVLGGHEVVIGPGLAGPVGMAPAELREIGRVHGILIDIIAAGQHVHFIECLEFGGRALVAPQDALDAPR